MPRTNTTAAPGDQIAVTHGAYSESLVLADVPAVIAELRKALADQILFIQGADVLVCEEMARVIVMTRRVDQWLDKKGGIIDGRGKPRAVWKLRASLDHQFRELCRILGVGPAIRAELVGNVGAKESWVARAARRAKEQR